jgi:hypothetical protein
MERSALHKTALHALLKRLGCQLISTTSFTTTLSSNSYEYLSTGQRQINLTVINHEVQSSNRLHLKIAAFSLK